MSSNDNLLNWQGKIFYTDGKIVEGYFEYHMLNGQGKTTHDKLNE
mgnify:CR=1 FL=1